MNRSVNRLSVAFCLAAFIFTLIAKSAFVMAMDDSLKRKIVNGMYEEYKPDFMTVEDITPDDVTELTKREKIVFVDVRSKNEMRVSTLPGAISQKEFLANRERFDNHVVVAYCTIGYRSGMFAKKMVEKNIRSDRIYNLRGGLLAWVLDGKKVYDTKGETRKIHVYGKRWDYPPSGYESIW